MTKRVFRTRLIFSIVFVAIIAAGAGVQYMLYYLCKNDKMPYMQGFLTAIPIAIVMFWFSCFFEDITVKKEDNERIYIIKKLPRRVLSTLFSVLSGGSILFWLYMYHTNIARLF